MKQLSHGALYSAAAPRMGRKSQFTKKSSEPLRDDVGL
jgi:hypothetical protein